jgi:hypothetical protein
MFPRLNLSVLWWCMVLSFCPYDSTSSATSRLGPYAHSKVSTLSSQASHQCAFVSPLQGHGSVRVPDNFWGCLGKEHRGLHLVGLPFGPGSMLRRRTQSQVQLPVSVHSSGQPSKPSFRRKNGLYWALSSNQEVSTSGGKLSEPLGKGQDAQNGNRIASSSSRPENTKQGFLEMEGAESLSHGHGLVLKIGARESPSNAIHATASERAQLPPAARRSKSPAGALMAAPVTRVCFPHNLTSYKSMKSLLEMLEPYVTDTAGYPMTGSDAVGGQ